MLIVSTECDLLLKQSLTHGQNLWCDVDTVKHVPSGLPCSKTVALLSLVFERKVTSTTLCSSSEHVENV